MKDETTAVLAAMGLSISDAIRLTLMRVVAEKAMPFELRVTNTVTTAAMTASRGGEGVARFNAADDLMADLNAVA